MQRIAVVSSSLRSVGYLEGEAVLEAEFRDGKVYRYFMVPAVTWARLLDAPSKGSFFNQHVRDVYLSLEIAVRPADTLLVDLEASLARGATDRSNGGGS